MRISDIKNTRTFLLQDTAKIYVAAKKKFQKMSKLSKSIMFHVLWGVMLVEEVTVSNYIKCRITPIFKQKPNPDKASHTRRLESSATLL
jgi:hypothetical protein